MNLSHDVVYDDAVESATDFNRWVNLRCDGLNSRSGLTVTPPSMKIALKFRIYPHPNQERELQRWLEELRFLWNHALGERRDRFAEGVKTSFVDQCRRLTRWRKNDPNGIGSVNAQVAQDTLHRLDDVFKAFFAKNAKYPSFKPRGATTSFQYPQAAESVRLDGRKILLSKLGFIPIIRHRDVPTTGLKTCTIKREGDRWYAILVYEVPDPVSPSTELPKNPIGIDLGLTHLVTLSDGTAVDPPRFLRRSQRRLGLAQRRLSRKVKGSNNRRHWKIRVARLHARIRAQRLDFAHKVSHIIAEKYDFVAMEDLDIRSLARKGRRSMRRSFNDAGWSQLRSMVAYKMRVKSKPFILVEPRGTTQTCSTCGKLADPPLALQDRIHPCHNIDRDLNAAKNILARGLNATTAGHAGIHAFGEVGPPLIAGRGRRVRSLNKEPLPSQPSVAT